SGSAPITTTATTRLTSPWSRSRTSSRQAPTAGRRTRSHDTRCQTPRGDTCPQVSRPAAGMRHDYWGEAVEGDLRSWLRSPVSDTEVDGGASSVLRSLPHAAANRRTDPPPDRLDGRVISRALR